MTWFSFHPVTWFPWRMRLAISGIAARFSHPNLSAIWRAPVSDTPTYHDLPVIFNYISSWKPYGHFFCPWWVLPVTDVCLFNCVFWFLIVKGCSNPLTTPCSDILRQFPREEFQSKVEQIGSRDRAPKSGHKYCHISHQIWMYHKIPVFFQHHVEKKQ